MAQLFFKYGTMNSGKSIEILKVAHNYEEQGKQVLVLTSSLDTRSKKNKITSRIGMSRKAISINPTDDVYDLVLSNIIKKQRPDCIIIDESQFLTLEQVQDLSKFVDNENIPIVAFGLKNDFQNNLFPGSRALLLYADKIEEIKTICWFCNKKATMNLRLNNGEPVYTGEQIHIGGNDEYVSVCRKHYNNPKSIKKRSVND